MPTLSSFHRSDLAGLPVYWADAGPPITASIVFRVGRADESLSTAGITHLLEHLVLFGMGTTAFQIDGFVENLRTVLYAEGSREEAYEFLAAVSGAIREPRLERLERERQVLLTEAEQWAPSPIHALMGLRFGALGHGLAGYPEYGLHRIQTEEAAGWVSRNFTRGNAAVWLTCPPPKEFEIELPAGSRTPPPELRTVGGLELPAYLAEGEGGVAISMTGTRSTALSSGLRIAADRAHKKLRIDDGLTYDIAHDYEPVLADTAHLMISADCLERHALTVRDELVNVLAELASQGPTKEELAKHIDQARRAMEDTRSVPGELDKATADELLGAPVQTRAEILSAIEALTEDDVASALDEVAKSAIVIAPEGVPPGRGNRVYEPRPSEERLSGQTYLPSALSRIPPLRSRSSRLISSHEGISAVMAEDDFHTIRFSQCVALLIHPDRSLEIVAVDGSFIELDIEGMPKGEELLADILKNVPSDKIVPLGEGARMWLAVEELARLKLKRRWVVSDELVVLAETLRPVEKLVNIAEANRGFKAGLLALTDQRLLFIYEGLRKKEALQLARDSITSIDGKAGSRRWSTSEIAVTASGQRYAFSEIVPRARTAEIVDELRARLPG